MIEEGLRKRGVENSPISPPLDPRLRLLWNGPYLLYVNFSLFHLTTGHQLGVLNGSDLNLTPQHCYGLLCSLPQVGISQNLSTFKFPLFLRNSSSSGSNLQFPYGIQEDLERNFLVFIFIETLNVYFPRL